MKNPITVLLACFLSTLILAGQSRLPAAPPLAAPAAILLREVRYDGRLSDDEAHFTVDIDAEVAGKGGSSLKLLEGEVAVLPAKLPDSLKIVRENNCYLLTAAHAGQFKFKLDVVAKIQRAEPWNQISFIGPTATIASVTAQAGGTGMEVQLLSGTLIESSRTNGISRVKGFLASDQTVALRWQGKVTEVARKVLLTVDSILNAQLTPAVIKYTSRFHYEIVQGSAAQLTLALAPGQALTRLAGEQIRDWRAVADGDRQMLTIEFIKPVEKSYDLTIYSEQTVEGAPANLSLNPPQPLEVERESGALTLSAEDALAEIESLTGLRQVNAAANALASYRFNARPFTLALKLKRIEPVISAADRVNARLEETRLIVSHTLSLTVEKAGIYALEFEAPSGMTVAEVRGEGVEDWNAVEGRAVRVNFSSRALGSRRLDIQLERALKTFPDQITVEPVRVVGAAKESAQIGVSSAAGIRLKTAEAAGLREIPVRMLQSRAGVSPAHPVVPTVNQNFDAPTQRAGETPALAYDELLAYHAEQPDWKLSLASERLTARVVADVFNLVTIGDGIVGGSATIRYGLVNQGVQEFKVQMPSQCRNVEFTGPNIRRKEQAENVWTIGLQEKAWGGYTLVVTYDYQFDSKGATLPVGGVHTLGVEHETGSIAVTTAASLQLSAKTASDSLRRLDESELAAADRALITRAVVLAYQYTDGQYNLAVDVKRYQEDRVIEAVADRTQITSVLTESGEMLTQASFMVKNNEKQSQRFLLPKGARLWGCYVNGQPVKPERDGEWVLVSLPREANRDQAFAVDIMYADQKGALASRWPRSIELAAPRTDVPNTYAEWQLFVPPSMRLSSFGGSMNVAQGTTYELLDAWEKFLAFYIQVLREAGGAILVIGTLAFLMIGLVISAARRGWNGILTVLGVLAILVVLAGMLLPALSKAKARAQRISSANNLKQIGVAAHLFAGDNNDRLPASFDEMSNELNTDKATRDPDTGQRYVYLGGGLSLNSLKPESVLAYSPIVNGQCNVLFADGHVEGLSAARFGELSQRGLVQTASPEEVARAQQQQAIRSSQLGGAPADGPAVHAAAAGGAVALAPGSGGNGLLALTPSPAKAPVAAGIRSIRIELPQTGTPFLFTKVLNVGNDPLSIRARIMTLHTFQTIQMAWQAAAFVLGLIVWWRQWRRAHRNTFALTLALALIFGSVGSLLIQWRALHDALIIGFPVVTLGVIALLVWKFWPRGGEPEPQAPPVPRSPLPGSSLPPVAAAIALFLALNLAPVSADDSVISNPQPAIGNVSILSAGYSGAVNDRVALLDVTLRFSADRGGQTVPLFGPEVAVQQFTVKNGEARLVREGGNIAVRLGNRGDVTVQIKMLVKISGDVTKRHLAFAIPAALSSQVALTLDQPEADVDFPTAISFKCAPDKEKTRVEAVIGSGDRIELLWTPRVKRAAEVAATIFCQNTALAAFGGGVVNVRAAMDFQVTQGELRQARVQLPAGQRLLRVEGSGIRTWECKEQNGAQVLVVDLLKGMSPAWRLTVETEKALDALPASVAVEAPHALDVKRETGLVALQNAEEVGLSVESASGLQRVDVEEFGRAQTGAGKTDGLLSVFRFSKPEFALRVRAEAVQPQIEAIVRNNVRLSADQAALSATIDYTIKRAGVFALKAALPAGYRVEQVTGDNILQWAERSEAGSRVLEATLRERTTGTCSIHLELAQTFKELPGSFAIAGVYPLNTAKLTGFVAVSAEPGVAVKMESFDGLTEIPAVSLPDYAAVAGAGSVLAYKFISAAPGAAPGWTLNVTTEAIESWVRAEIVNTITLAETLVSGRATVRYDIANAPVKELRVKVPAAFKNVEISGANIRSRSQTGDVWRVELQSGTRGLYTLTVTWEQNRASGTNGVELIGVSAEGVERETGLLAIAAKKPLQVTELNAADLQRADAGDFPDWAGRPDGAAALAYRYVRPGYQLTVNTRRFGEAEVLQALVDNARFTTVVADDGQMMTEMSLSVRNNGRQFLEIELPAGAAIWSVFVAGQPVRPSRSNGKLLLPLQASGADEGATTVELTYVGANSFPRKRGQVRFDSPKFDVPLKNARWELFLPPDYEYQDFAGSMTPESAAKEPSSANFSLLEYTRMERASQASAKAEWKRDVSEVQRQLAGGNVREANANFNRAKGKFHSGKDEEADVKKLEKELQSAQGSNLINAQNDFTLRNNGQIGGGESALPNQSLNLRYLRYDNSAAEQQWAKLQQAQEIVAAAAQPLHINLPIRGLRHAFTQVLQTEISKPMTIQLLAISTKAVSWPKRAAAAVVAFLVLWVAVAAVSRVTRRQVCE